MKGIQQRRTYGSLDDTIITIEDGENTPLLLNRVIWQKNNYSNNRNYGNTSRHVKAALKYGLSSWSFDSSYPNNRSNYSAGSTKTFKSHFTELKVLAFVLFLAVTIGVAIYLLVIDSYMPPIILSLDLVSHDIWSRKTIQKCNHLHYSNVDHIILMQTTNRNCDTSGECLEILAEMQNNEPEELPYNFLIGGDGHVYEVRGWKYQSSIKGIPQGRSIVIGIIGYFDQRSPQNILLRSIKSLIQQSSKRRMINRKYLIYGLIRNDIDRHNGLRIFNKIIDWPEFNGFLTN